MNLMGIGSIIEGVGKIADDLSTSHEERLKIVLQEKTIEVELVKGQLEINKAEAQHKSVFVTGWRPAIGWVGAIALGYQFILSKVEQGVSRESRPMRRIEIGFSRLLMD